MQLLLDVSHALHDEARENAATKAFHVMSMSLLGTPDVAAHARDQQTAAHRYLGLFDRKRSSCRDLRGDPDGNKCLGMCGAGCWCWNLVCNDCCYHQGCYEHDLCCRKKRLSGYCLFPFLYGFNCDSYGGYPSCVQKCYQFMSVRVLQIEKQDMKAGNLHLSCFCNNVNLRVFFHIKSRRKINGITAWENTSCRYLKAYHIVSFPLSYVIS